METVTLLPATKRLKQIIREHGDQWVLLERREVQCFQGRVGCLIAATKDGVKADSMRWVLPEHCKPCNEGASA